MTDEPTGDAVVAVVAAMRRAALWLAVGEDRGVGHELRLQPCSERRTRGRGFDPVSSRLLYVGVGTRLLAYCRLVSRCLFDLFLV